jgi:chromosome segregation ATPase
MERLSRVLAHEISALESRVATGRDTVARVQAEAETLERENDGQRAALDALQRHHASLATELEALAVERSRQAAELEALAAQRRRQAAEFEALVAERGDLGREIAEQRAALANLHDSTAAAHAMLHERDLAAEELHGLNRQIEALRSELAQSRDENARVKQDVQVGRTEFQVIYNRERNVLAKLKRDVALTQRQHDDLLRQVTALQLTLDEHAAIGSGDHDRLDR